MLLGLNIAFLLHLLISTLVVAQIMSREYLSPVKRLAWLLVIYIFPIGGILLYFIFGQARLVNVKNQHEEFFSEIQSSAENVMGCANSQLHKIEACYHPGFKYAESIHGFGLTVGNKIELIKDENSATKRIIEDIDNAQEFVNIIYYIWLNDNTGTSIAQALMRAAARGVTCRVMADGIGSRKLVASNLWKDMANAGVKVSVALPLTNVLRTLFFSRIDLRNHRKITVIDGRITYCGSQNCADPEFRHKAKYAPWIDIMLRCEGPVAAQNNLLFASDWLQNESAPLEDFIYDTQPSSSKNGVMAQIWGDGPVDRIGATPQLLSCLINSARKELVISTPYFVPEETVLNALYAAAHRGIKVTLIFPKHNDSWVVKAASESYYVELLEAGITIMEHEGGLLHSKTLTIDGVICMVGSTNIDLRSFDLNYENNMLLYGSKITAQIYNRQMEYISQSSQVTLDHVTEWSLPHRMWINIVATLGPVL